MPSMKCRKPKVPSIGAVMKKVDDMMDIRDQDLLEVDGEKLSFVFVCFAPLLEASPPSDPLPYHQIEI